MREDLLDILHRLVGVRQALGEERFNQACHRARLAIAVVAMEHAKECKHTKDNPEDPRLGIT